MKAYLKLLTWDIVEAPAITRWTERALNPVLGKSLIVYARKPAHAPVGVAAPARTIDAGPEHEVVAAGA